jgi:hypothetical protein
MSKNAGDAIGGERAAGGESVTGFFTGHEAAHGAANEAETRRSLAQPRTLRGFQNRCAAETHCVELNAFVKR